MKYCKLDYGNVGSSSVIIQEQYFSASLEEGQFYVNMLTYNRAMFFCVVLDGKWFSNNFAQFIANELRNYIYHIVRKLQLLYTRKHKFNSNANDSF